MKNVRFFHREDYTESKGPNAALRHGPDPSRVVGSQGANGPDPSLHCGPQCRPNYSMHALRPPVFSQV